MSTENKSKDQSWIRRIWFGNKVLVILCLIGIPVIGLNIILETPFLELILQFVTIIWSQYQDIVLSIIICIVIVFILGICIDATLPNVKKNKIISWIEKPVLYILSGVVPIAIITLVYKIWERIHQYTPNVPQIVCLILFVFLSTAGLTVIIGDLNKKIEAIVAWRAIKRLLFPMLTLPIIIILALLILDLIAIFSAHNLNSLYQRDLETRKFIFALYAGALASIVFGVTLYVAYIRHTSLKLSEKQFEHAQEQFSYTQTQKQEEEIEKRFQEGIKLLGNEQESVRLGGVFVLWEIVKDAIKALPYLENENIYYATYINRNGKHFSLPYRLETTNHELDKAKQIKLKEYYLKEHVISDTKISAYKKAFTLYEQILDILCAHIRTKTNSEDYLREYYPSIYQGRYPQRFKEYFGKKGQYNQLNSEEEKPSNEIQSLLYLLLSVPNNIIDIFEPQKYHIPTQALDYRLNFSNAILRGGDFAYAYFNKAYCAKADFQNIFCKKANFENTYCCDANFQKSTCINASFKNSNLNGTNFEESDCSNASFQKSTCINTNFKKSKLFNANFQETNCSKAVFQEAQCFKILFQSANCTDSNFQDANCQGANFQGADLSHTNFRNAKFNNHTDIRNTITEGAIFLNSNISETITEDT